MGIFRGSYLSHNDTDYCVKMGNQKSAVKKYVDVSDSLIANVSGHMQFGSDCGPQNLLHQFSEARIMAERLEDWIHIQVDH